jgi:hypothetical protein
MGWFSKKKKKVPYIPKGRVGYLRKELSNLYYFTVIFEEIGRIGARSKIRVIEVDIDRDCNKTEGQCLTRWGIGDWLNTESIHWENDQQRAERFGQETPVTYEMEEEELEEDIQYTLTPHNFTD